MLLAPIRFSLARGLDWTRRQERGPGNDSSFLNVLRRAAHRFGATDWMLLADAGFDGQAVTEGDLIPPIRWHGGLVAPSAKPERSWWMWRGWMGSMGKAGSVRR
ncbi:hypothetical protein HYR54_05430 [Candidatus Acetothermia bacterium]|nr:hypothetical protein [Candidatus Acetothermia bacterium]